MAKEWFYQLMGDEVGPVSSGELKRRAQQGDILPDTLVRSAPDGKWTPAERVKGLIELPPVVFEPEPVKTVPTKAVVSQPPPPKSDTATTIPLEKPGEDRVYHFTGDTAVVVVAEAPESGEYDFFQMVGFELALGTPLHQALVDRCRTQHVTMTEVTRRALAEFLGRKDLLESAVADETVAAKSS
jgi:hypothetical protein